MLALLERSRSARIAVVLFALGAVFGLAGAATAENDFGFRHAMLWPEPQPARTLVDVPVAQPVRHYRARRIWAASRSRPLRITLIRRRHRTRFAQTRRVAPRFSVARLRPSAEPQVVFPRLIVLPKPPRPAIVSIYQDRTLRDGDAVMMADGIHVFRGVERTAHQPRDFIRLAFVTALDWHLRKTFDALDKNPPTRWSSLDSTAG